MSTIKNKNNKKINFCVYFLNLVHDVAIIRKSMVTSSGIEQGQRKLLFDLKSEKRAKNRENL